MADAKNNAKDFIPRIFYQATYYYKGIKKLKKCKDDSKYNRNPM